ncbi:MAG TPA: hypothetical protein EYP39_03920 [Ghiorsea sp.]|nr:hypothetical protein [Ghiorsea sp.]
MPPCWSNNQGQQLRITGQQAPCPRCRGEMNSAVTDSGGSIIYQWREGGLTQSWIATPR